MKGTEHFDLRHLFEIEVANRELDPSVVDKAIKYIKDNEPLMRSIGGLVDLAIDRVIE